MKKVIPIVLILISHFSIAQEQSIPFKKANTIIVYHNLDLEAAFERMYKLLVENGYPVIEANERFHFLVTEEVKKNGAYSLAIRASVDESKILLSGTYSGTNIWAGSTYENNKAIYRNAKTAPDRVAFDKMIEIAKKFPNGVVKYTKL